MIDYINSHMPAFWMTLGLALLATEVVVLGFTTVVLIFAGLGAIATGALMAIDVLPQTWIAGLAGFGLISGALGVLLWKPLRRMQQSSPGRQSSSDFTGLEFVLDKDISKNQTTLHRYSGINWRVELDGAAGCERIAAGQRVRVVSVGVGVFRVMPA